MSDLRADISVSIRPIANKGRKGHRISMFKTLSRSNAFTSSLGALALLAAVTWTTPALACRIPWRFVPANETHEVVVVAKALRRDDWGRFSYDTGQPIDRETGESPRFPHAREWTAELETLSVLKGEAIPIIQVAPDLPVVIGDTEAVLIFDCWDGIETPQVGRTYAVYLNRRDGALTTTRLLSINFAIANDPLFSSADAIAAPDQ